MHRVHREIRLVTTGPAHQALNCETECLLVGHPARIPCRRVSTQLGELGTKIEVGHGLTPLKVRMPGDRNVVNEKLPRSAGGRLVP